MIETVASERSFRLLPFGGERSKMEDKVSLFRESRRSMTYIDDFPEAVGYNKKKESKIKFAYDTPPSNLETFCPKLPQFLRWVVKFGDTLRQYCAIFLVNES